jgi:soluble lytic murein transglycosylase-like protein
VSSKTATTFLLIGAVVIIIACCMQGKVHPAAASVQGARHLNAAMGTRQYYINLARQDALDAGIPPDVFVRQMNYESGFNPDEVGAHGEIGIAQFMPQTATGLGIQPDNSKAALQGAAQLMRRYLKHYGGNYAQALASYNCGATCVADAIAQGGLQWQDYIPASTREYIKNILNENE